MSEQYPGGYISKSPPVPNGTTAPGLWTLSQQAGYQTAGTWPPVIPVDAQFNYVTMLLHGDGTNGAQNNTFLDSSSNAFTITRNGNTTQGSFSPYGSLWSNYFNGTSDYITYTNNNSLVVSSNPFSIEAWVYLSAATVTSHYIINQFNSGNKNWIFGVGAATNKKLGFYYSKTGSDNFYFEDTNDFPVNTWCHVCACRTGNTMSIFINGVRVATTTETGALYSSTTNPRIGASSDTSSTPPPALWTGYISNIRMVKGSNPYDATATTLTVPTTPLTAITNTSLLTCQSNRFIDNSTNAVTLTPSGTPSVQRFNPFGTSTAYSTATIGGSGYFDGTGDYLSAAANAAFQFGTGDFCIEYWYYPTSFPTYTTTINSGYTLTGGYVIQAATDGKPYFYTSGATLITSTTAYTLNAWNHFAVCRSGTTLSMFINGVRVGTTTNSTNYNLSAALDIGIGSTYPIYGYMGDVRLVKGASVYTPSSTTLTVPTAPLTAIANTSLLLSMTNAGIYDNAMMNDLETVGNAQISTSVKKYGTGSLAFDGTGDYLKLSNNTSTQAIGFGTGDFTIECWVYPTTSATANNGVYDCRYSSSATGPLIYNIPSSGLYMFYNGSNVITGSNPTTNTWSHIALVRSSGVTKLYLNGVQTGSNYTDTNNYTSGANSGVVGAFYDGTASFNGYIDDIRITKGYARYTTTFTPPTAAFPNIGPV